mmetsp:Transcript_18527/g.17844  ORF Transcript_18527/g.17844 Transcript_18527/m.17844 type:complete len:201 (-) Transcript_18527:34-636(-)
MATSTRSLIMSGTPALRVICNTLLDKAIKSAVVIFFSLNCTIVAPPATAAATASSMVCPYFSLRDGSVTAYTDKSTGLRALGIVESIDACTFVVLTGMALAKSGAMCNKGPWLPVPMEEVALICRVWVRYFRAERTACNTVLPLASSEAMAEERVQPVPCTFSVLTSGPLICVNCCPSKSTSTISPVVLAGARCPPLTNT